MTNTINALNKKYQARVNQVYKADRLYHVAADHSAFLDSYDASKYEISKAAYKQEVAFNKFENLWETLPKREQANANKQYTVIHGYSLNYDL